MPPDICFWFGEQVLNSKLALKNEIEQVLTSVEIDMSTLSRPEFNKVLDQRLYPWAGSVNLKCSANLATPARRWVS